LRKKIIAGIFFVLLVGVGILVYLGQRTVKLEELYYSGTIEARCAELSFQVSGRVVDLPADEGRAIEENEVLAVLDQSEYQAKYEQAKAIVESAIKKLQRAETVVALYKETLPYEVARAEAGVNVLISQLRELQAGSRRQEIKRARLSYLTAKDIMEEAAKDKRRFEKLFQQNLVSEKQWDEVRLNYETAVKEFERAEETLKLLEEGARVETIETAKARVAEGRVALQQAKANMKKIEEAQKEVETAEAGVKEARSALKLAQIYLDHTHLRAPFSGVITSRNVELGEVVSPTREILSLADLSTVELKIFVGEEEIGNVKPGQRAEVRIDTFPDKRYMGKVSFISPEAEFTPKMIQTHKERVKLVYLVKVALANPNYELKPGMPADAWLR